MSALLERLDRRRKESPTRCAHLAEDDLARKVGDLADGLVRFRGLAPVPRAVSLLQQWRNLAQLGTGAGHRFAGERWGELVGAVQAAVEAVKAYERGGGRASASEAAEAVLEGAALAEAVRREFVQGGQGSLL